MDITAYTNDLKSHIGYDGVVDTKTIDVAAARRIADYVLAADSIDGAVDELAHDLAKNMGLQPETFSELYVKQNTTYLFCVCAVADKLMEKYQD